MIKNILSLFYFAAQPLDILWVVLIALVSAALIIFLFLRAKRDRMYFIDLSDKKRLFNTKEFNKSVEISIKLKSNFYIFQLYAKDFKDLSALHGKTLLDDMLDKAVRRLEAEMPQGVRICSCGEGRILVYIKEDKRLNIEAFAKSIKETAVRKTVLGKQPFVIDFTVVAGRYPSDGASLHNLLENMEIVLTGVKRNVSGMGANSDADNASPALGPQLKGAKEVEEIRSAIKNKEFVLYYQPVIERKTMNVIGAECLIRWRHPKKGIMPPSAFLPILERTGEIYLVGIRTFDEACRQLGAWRKDPSLPKIWLSINMSMMQLSKPEIVKEFTKSLRKHNLSASDFYFEIYDIALYGSSANVKETIDGLVAMGFQISIDKFGKGKASLTELEKFPLTQIKVDMPFLLHAKENVLYSGIINALNDYVRQNSIMMIADGVENADQVEWSKLYGLNYMQGFYFAKPSDADEFVSSCLKEPSWRKTAVKGNGGFISSDETEKTSSAEIKNAESKDIQ